MRFADVNRPGKIRLIVFVAILAFLTYLSIGYSVELGALLREVKTREIASTQSGAYTVDGADFSWLIQPISVIGANLEVTIIAFVYMLITGIAGLVLFAIFHGCVFRKNTWVTDAEYAIAKKIHKWVCLAVCLVSVICVGLSAFTWAVSGMLFCFPMFVYGWLLYVFPLRRRLLQTEDDRMIDTDTKESVDADVEEL